MDQISYIKNLVYAFLKDDTMVTERVMIVKHYNTLDMKLEDIEKLSGDTYKKGLLYHRYTKNDIKEPYEPLIGGIRYYYQKLFSSEMTVEEFVEASNVFQMQKEIFVSFIENGNAYRHENAIITEGKFEANKFIQSIINCLSYIAKKCNLLIVLDKFQLAGLSSMRVINTMINELKDYNIKILIIYNELQPPYDYARKEFVNIIQRAEDKNILFEWESDEELPMSDYHAGFIPNKRFFRDYLSKLDNLYKMFAIEDARYYISIIDAKIAEDKLSIDVEDKIKFYAISAMCDILLNDNNSALLICDKMYGLFDEKTDKRTLFLYNYLCGTAQMLMTVSDLSIRFAKRCLEISKDLQDEHLIFASEILINSVQFSGWRDVFSVDFNKISISEEFLKKLEEKGYYNLLAYFLIFSFDNSYEDIEKFIKNGGSDTYKRAISIAKERGNNNLLLSAFSKYIVVFSDRGFIRNTDMFYNAKFEILNSDHDTLRLTHFFMGVGYNHIISEQYNKANENFCKAIECMFKMRNAEGLIEALYNMTINCFCAQDYMSACYYIESITKMLSNLDMETIQICNAPKLYGIQALAYNIIGNEYRSYKCQNNMEIRLSHLLFPEPGETPDTAYWNEDLFLYYFVNAILAKNNNDYVAALSNFKKADTYFEKCASILFYAIVHYVTEYTDLLTKLDNKEKAKEVIEFGIDYCKKNGFVVKAQTLTHLLEGKYSNIRPLSTDFSKISIEQMIELSAHIGKEKKLVARDKDIKFLSSLQETLNRENTDTDMLIKNTMMSLQNNNNLDSVLLLGFNNGQKEILYKDLDYEIDIDIDEIFDFFKHYKHEFIVSRTEKTFTTDFSKIVNIFGKNKIVSMVGIPLYEENNIKMIFIATINMHRNLRRNRIIMSKEALVIIKTAVIQLRISVERTISRKNIVMMNEKLNSLAITDMLTGLYNRQGLSKKIEESQNSNNSISILYADLDNFKYYNDTFGHDVGDIILVEFAKVFKKVSAKLGYAVRYGGDEFLVVLNNVSEEVVCQVADEIYDTIKDGFVDLIKQKVDESVVIPKDKLVSCSIGIATSEKNGGENVADTLKKADEALYYMKKNHKGGYILWEKLNEQK